jgi:transposase-like protein
MALTREQQDKIFELLDKGYRVSEIAKQIGCSKNTVAKYKKEHERMKGGQKSGEAEGKEEEKAIAKKEPVNMLDMFGAGKSVNILDLARDEKDVSSLGVQSGMVVGSIVDDAVSAFDSTKPMSVRLAKAMRGTLTAGSLIFGAVETWKQIDAQRKLSQRVQKTTITKAELKEQIMAVLSKKNEPTTIEELAKELDVSYERVIGATDELESEGKLERGE